MSNNTKDILIYNDYCNNIVRQSNDFTLALNSWSLNAKKVSRIFGSLFNRYPDKDFFYFKSLDVARFLGFTQTKAGSAYAEIPKVTKEIMSKVIAIPLGNKKFRQLPMLAMVDHDLGYGIFGVKVHPDTKDFFIELSDNATVYKLSQVMPLKSSYSFDLYELLKANRNLSEITFTIEYLRLKLNAKDLSYDKYDNFKRKVIEVACKEITEKTDINVVYEPIKESRKVVSIKFIYSCSENIEEEVVSEDVIDTFAHTHEIIEAFKNSTNGADISASTLTELLKLQSFEVVKDYAEHINDYIGTSVSNIQGFFIDAVKKHGTTKQYLKVRKLDKVLSNTSSRNNFEQRELTEDYINENFFSNMKQ